MPTPPTASDPVEVVPEIVIKRVDAVGSGKTIIGGMLAGKTQAMKIMMARDATPPTELPTPITDAATLCAVPMPVPEGGPPYRHEIVVDAEISRDLERQLADTTADRDRLQRIFDLRWNADMRAIRMWQEKNPGDDDVWPDHADLVVWLMERLGEATARIAELENHLSPKPDDGWVPWSGGECPIPDGVPFFVRLRNGNESRPRITRASEWHWGYTGGSDDIVAYRVMSDSP